MTNLIRDLRDLSLFKPKEERIMVFGNDASGKTTLLYRLKFNELVTAIPTIGFNIETIPHQNKRFTLWDVGGCDKIRPLWQLYVAKDTSVIYLHNPIDERIDESLDGVRDAAGMMKAVNARFMWIVFNKQDLLPPDQACAILADHRAKFEMELLAHAPDLEWQFVDLPGLSAMTGERCSELLGVLHDTIMNGPKKTTSSASAALPRRAKTLSDAPTEAELIAHIETERDNDLNGSDFWDTFLSGKIAQWNHRCHLRAGYILLLDTLRSGEGIFECAEVFLEHLQRLKETAPDRFRNTEHRTMTIFWLYNLQLAILSFKSDKRLDKYPGRESFDDVLLHSPYLMYGGLWKEWYTKDLMMSPEAKQYWRLPDLQALPDFAQKTQTQKRHVRRLSQDEPYRLMRFAFAVVQKYMSSDIRRGWLVKQSLAALQTTTMRLRAQNPDMPPYSETKAYFWIQVIHAALGGARDASSKDAFANMSLERLSFSSFRVLFDMDPSLWRKCYTPNKWDSLEARVEFVPPDLQPLPNVISVPSAGNVILALERQIDSARIGMAAEIPSMEELAMRSSILLDEVASMSEEQIKSANIISHAHLLRFLFERLADKSDDESTPAVTKAITSMVEIEGSYANLLTLKAFWTQQVLAATTKGDVNVTFEDLIRANLHLVYPELPLCYFSQELLQSLDAKEKIVPPDRRKLKGFLPVAGSRQEEEDWVVM